MPNLPDTPEEWENSFEYLPIQEWFMAKKLRKRHHLNISFLIRVPEKLDRDRLKRALEKLNDLHAMLRAAYPGGKQVCRKNNAVAEIRELDIRGKTAEEIQRELTGWQSEFDLEQGYLWQSGILTGYDDHSERVFLALHHMLADPLSLRIIRDDLRELYAGRELEKTGSGYRQWSEAVNKLGNSITAEEKRYWEMVGMEQEEAWQPAEPALQSGDESQCSRVEFTSDITAKLSEQTMGDTGASPLLLSALSHALYEVGGKKRNWITMERPGRPELDKRLDVKRTVGWFTVMYPFRLIATDNLAETMANIDEHLRNVPSDGIGYGALHGYDRLPRVLFHYLGNVDWMTESDWSICLKEPSGECISPENRFEFVVELNGAERDGKIGFWIISSLDEKNHDLLCAAFRRNVEAIALCRDRHGKRDAGQAERATPA